MGKRNAQTQQAPAGATEIPVPVGAESSIHSGTYMSPLPGLNLLAFPWLGRHGPHSDAPAGAGKPGRLAQVNASAASAVGYRTSLTPSPLPVAAATKGCPSADGRGGGRPSQGSPLGLEFLHSPPPPWGEGPGEGVNAVKPETTQRCPQVSGENAGRRVVVAQCFQRRVVSCKRTGPGSRPPQPAPSSPRGRCRKLREAKKSQHKRRSSSPRARKL